MLQNKALQLSGLRQQKPLVTSHSFCWWAFGCFWHKVPHAAVVTCQWGCRHPRACRGLEDCIAVKSVLAVTGGPPIPCTWASPPGCLRVLVTWHLASPGANDPRHQGQKLRCLLRPSLGSHALPLSLYFISHMQDQPGVSVNTRRQGS